MLQVILNKSWKQYLIKQQLYGHRPPITNIVQIKQSKHAGCSWRSKNELISDVFQWTSSHGHASVRWPARTYLQQLCVDTGCSEENLPGAMDDERELGKSVQVAWHDDCDDDINPLFYYSTKTIQVRRTRHAGHCLRSRDEVISDILLWTPSHGQAKAGRPARSYIQQLYADTGCSLEDLPGAMDDREGLQERVREICASGTIWWWF